MFFDLKTLFLKHNLKHAPSIPYIPNKLLIQRNLYKYIIVHMKKAWCQ